MGFEVIQKEEEYKLARAELRRRGLDCTSWWIAGILRKYGFLEGITIGDVKKSWDILKAVELIEKNLAATEPILDIGAYRSEILPILKRIGYRNLTGIDLNENMAAMPGGDTIHYRTANCYNSPFASGSFAAVTAISVIEHGFDCKRLLSELARILRPGGYFIASIDYWPEKIDTSGIQEYGMDWRIFSRQEVVEFLAEAKTSGFQPLGELSFAAGKPVVSWMGKKFTFAWMALEKVESESQ